jgi:hypothetical protein
MPLRHGSRISLFPPPAIDFPDGIQNFLFTCQSGDAVGMQKRARVTGFKTTLPTVLLSGVWSQVCSGRWPPDESKSRAWLHQSAQDIRAGDSSSLTVIAVPHPVLIVRRRLISSGHPHHISSLTSNGTLTLAMQVHGREHRHPAARAKGGGQPEPIRDRVPHIWMPR